MVLIEVFAVCSAVLTVFWAVFAVDFSANLIELFPADLADCLMDFSAGSKVLILCFPTVLIDCF